MLPTTYVAYIGGYLVWAFAQMVLIWLVQLIGYVVGVVWFLSGWCSWLVHRWSYLVLIWLMQLIGYIVGVIWSLSG